MKAPQFDLYSIDYLNQGSARQRRAARVLHEARIWDRLREIPEIEFALAGSLPLDLAAETSDLDIVVSVADLKVFLHQVREAFGQEREFAASLGLGRGGRCVLASFVVGHQAGEQERIEIFAQTLALPLQAAIMHLLVEARLMGLAPEDSTFIERLREARLSGLKTEEAFGVVLGLSQPYEELLALDELSDRELALRFAAQLR